MKTARLQFHKERNKPTAPCIQMQQYPTSSASSSASLLLATSHLLQASSFSDPTQLINSAEKLPFVLAGEETDLSDYKETEK